jgi:Putative rRNA methylase
VSFSIDGACPFMSILMMMMLQMLPSSLGDRLLLSFLDFHGQESSALRSIHVIAFHPPTRWREGGSKGAGGVAAWRNSHTKHHTNGNGAEFENLKNKNNYLFTVFSKARNWKQRTTTKNVEGRRSNSFETMIVISQSFSLHLTFLMAAVMAMIEMKMVKGFGFFAFQRKRIFLSRGRARNPSSVVKKHSLHVYPLFSTRFPYSRSTGCTVSRRPLYLATASSDAAEEDGLSSSSFSSPRGVRDFSTGVSSRTPPLVATDTKTMTRSLLSSLIQRSRRTLADKSSSSLVDISEGLNNKREDENNTTYINENGVHEDDRLFAIDQAVQDILDTAAAAVAVNDHGNAKNSNKKQEQEEEVRIGYNSNPTITSTALAHLLWSHVLLQPNVGVVDSHKNIIAIDATAGNGADSVALARMLFLQNSNNDSCNHNKLICIDIQPEACETTRNELANILPRDVLENQVDIHRGSHASLLSLLTDSSSSNSNNNNNRNVALVVYNLGFLPNSTSSVLTCTESTISSMADAVLSIRVGGLLSVMTYPRTNREEDWAVHVFLEGLALFSSKTDDWQEFVATSYSSSSSFTEAVSMETHRQQEVVRRLILETLLRVKNEGPPNQTWRVHEYKKLGWRDAPILLTASRIK